MRTATQVTAVRLSGDDVEVRLAGGRSIVGRTLVSTVPTAALLAMIAAPPEVTAAADQLEFRAALLVYLTVPRDRYTAFDAHYFPELTTVISRLSEPKNYRTSTADPAEQTVVCAEVPATIGDDLWMSEDDVMIERVRRELCAQGLSDPTPTNGRVERRSHVYPVYRTGFESSRDIVETYFRCQPNLAVLGRQALFAHDNTHHALLMGKSVVDTLDDHARIDRRRWDDALRSFDSHVVED